MRLIRYAFYAIALGCLLFGCGADVTDPPSGRGPGGGAPGWCPDTADLYAKLNSLPIPYPANPMNPTAYDPLLPPPYFYHPCLTAAGAMTYRSGVPCFVCTDSSDYYSITLGDSACTQDADRFATETFVICARAPDGMPDQCGGTAGPAGQFCQ